LATHAVEYMRLTGVAGFLWNHWIKTGPDGNPLPSIVSLIAIARARLLSWVGSTRIGSALIRRCKRLRDMARKLLAKF
jgi:hypothetical protein